MAISEKDVEHIARLARLKVTPEERRLYQGQLENILEHMAELNSLDTRQVAPTSSVLGLVDVMRADEPKPFADTESILAGAPAREGPYFKVPKVIE